MLADWADLDRRETCVDIEVWTRHRPGDPVIRVFAYSADPAGRSPEVIAEEMFAIRNGHPATPAAGTCRAVITHASCGRCPSPESRRVAAGCVATGKAECGLPSLRHPDQQRFAMPSPLTMPLLAQRFRAQG